MNGGDDYLWDQSGVPDPEIEALERALGPLAHAGTPLDWRRLRRRRRWPLLLAAAVLLATALLWVVARGGVGEAVALTIVREGRSLGDDQWFTATAESRELRLARGQDWLGDLTLDPGSRLQVLRLSGELTRLALAAGGRLQALVSADVRPRFFQVDTPAARCVDLGCEYDLEVDLDGNARVSVTFGWVAFEFERGDRVQEVFVPRGAECRARRGRGPGTPRFRDAGAGLVRLLDAYDDAAAGAPRRRDLARKICAAVSAERDTLVLYHLLLDGDPVVVAAAGARLVELVGLPPDAAGDKVPDDVDPGLWLAHLRWLWH